MTTIKPWVYLAGPYSAPDPVENTHNILHLATDLLRGGQVTPVVPHLSLLWHLVTPLPYETWLAYDAEILTRCDALLRIPGDSSGADGEQRLAEEAGIPVFDCVDDLLEWAAQRARSDRLGTVTIPEEDR